MIDNSNPAGRLYKILSSAKSQNRSAPVKDVWATVLNLPKDDMAVIQAVTEVYKLSQEVQTLLKLDSNINHQLYLTEFVALERAMLPVNLTSPWASTQQHLTESAMTRLQFCAEALSGDYSEENFAQEDIKEISRLIDELFECINQSDLTPQMRISLLEEIEKIRHALNMYRIHGAKGLRNALQGTVGALVVNKDGFRDLPQSSPVTWNKLISVLTKMHQCISVALRIKAIGQDIAKLIGYDS